VIGLPPMFRPFTGMTIDVISRYDDKGPAWYWNTVGWASIPARISMRPFTGSPGRSSGQRL